MEGFRKNVHNWANESAFNQIMETIDKIQNPNDRVKHYLALLSWAMPKVSSIDFLGENARDITINLVRERGHEQDN